MALVHPILKGVKRIIPMDSHDNSIITVRGHEQ